MNKIVLGLLLHSSTLFSVERVKDVEYFLGYLNDIEEEN